MRISDRVIHAAGGDTLAPSRRAFLLAQLITRTGDSLHGVSLLLLVYAKTGSSLRLGMNYSAGCAGAAAGFLLVPLLRGSSPVRVMQVTDLFSGLIVALLPFFPVHAMPLVVLLLGVSRSVNGPLAESIVPKLAPSPDGLRRLNADVQGLASLASLIAFPLAFLTLAFLSLSWVFAMNAISFFACALVNGRITPAVAPAASAPRRADPTYARRLAATVRLALDDASMFGLVLPGSIAMGMSMIFDSQLVPLVRSLRPAATDYVIAAACSALGIMTTAAALRRSSLGAHLARHASAAWVGAGVTLGVLTGAAANAHSFVTLLAALVVAGGCKAVWGVAQSSTLQSRAGSEHLGHLLASTFFVRNFCKAVLAWGLGLAAERCGLSAALTVVGLAIAIFAAASSPTIWRRRERIARSARTR